MMDNDEPQRPNMGMMDQNVYSPDQRRHDLYSDANVVGSPSGHKQASGQKMSKTGTEFGKLPPRSPNKYSSKMQTSSALR